VLDVDGYLACVQRCRERYPQLRILTGVEVGEAHRHPEEVAALLAGGRFQRVLGSLHCLPLGDDRYAEPPNLYRRHPAADVIRDYLAEVVRLVTGSDAFEVLAHLDYPIRYWPQHAGPFDVRQFEAEFRHALRTLADSGRVLEVNTAGPMLPELVAWWRDEGGTAVSFGSDAHRPVSLARRFDEATAMVESSGFRPGRHRFDFWVRS
jgi:histidinol-phosphatase (PHP family)